MTQENKRKLHLFITVCVMIFIFMQSALPGPLSGAESNFLVRLIQNLFGIESELLPVFVRKAAHFTEYMILGACISTNSLDWMEYKEWNITIRRAGLYSWLIGTFYAVTDEIHQYFVPERACALLDVCIDSAGVALGVLIIMICRRKI